MFNSKKKKAAAAETERERRAQTEAIQAQLEAVRNQRSALDERLTALDQASAQLDARLVALDHGVSAISEEVVKLSSANTVTNQHLRSIDDHVVAGDLRVDAISQRLGDVEMLASDIDDINQRLSSFASTPSTAPGEPPPPPPTVPTPPPPVATDAASAAPPPASPLTNAATSDFDERIAELRSQIGALAEKTTSIDARVTSVSMELANQLTELSNDIDELDRLRSESSAAGGTGEINTAELEARITQRLDAAMEDVLDSTEHLAAEQARYEIQFRADLAELAERLRRPNA